MFNNIKLYTMEQFLDAQSFIINNKLPIPLIIFTNLNINIA